MSYATWYYAKGGKQLGPFTLNQMQQFAAAGTLLPTDLVWEADARDAVPASSVSELFSSAHPTPTSAPKASPVRTWALEYAGVGAVGAVASLFSPDLRAAALVGGLAAGLMCFVAASSSDHKVPAVVFGLLGAVVGAAAGAITFSLGVLGGVVLSAAVGAAAGVALGYVIAARDRNG